MRYAAIILVAILPFMTFAGVYNPVSLSGVTAQIATNAANITINSNDVAQLQSQTGDYVTASSDVLGSNWWDHTAEGPVSLAANLTNDWTNTEILVRDPVTKDSVTPRSYVDDVAANATLNLYLNGGATSITYGSTNWLEMTNTPLADIAIATNTIAATINADDYLLSFASGTGVITEIKAGVVLAHIHALRVGNPSTVLWVKGELYEIEPDGTATNEIEDGASVILSLVDDLIDMHVTLTKNFTIPVTSRLGFRIKATIASGAVGAEFHTRGDTASRIGIPENANAYVHVTGDTMTGPLTLSGDDITGAADIDITGAYKTNGVALALGGGSGDPIDSRDVTNNVNYDGWDSTNGGIYAAVTGAFSVLSLTGDVDITSIDTNPPFLFLDGSKTMAGTLLLGGQALSGGGMLTATGLAITGKANLPGESFDGDSDALTGTTNGWFTDLHTVPWTGMDDHYFDVSGGFIGSGVGATPQAFGVKIWTDGPGYYRVHYVFTSDFALAVTLPYPIYGGVHATSGVSYTTHLAGISYPGSQSWTSTYRSVELHVQPMKLVGE